MPTRLNFRNGPLKVSNTCWRQNWPIKIVAQLPTQLSGTDSSWALNFWVSHSCDRDHFPWNMPNLLQNMSQCSWQILYNLKENDSCGKITSTSIKPCCSYSLKIVWHVFVGSIVPLTCSANWSETFGVITQTQWQNAKKVIKKPAKKSMPYL